MYRFVAPCLSSIEQRCPKVTLVCFCTFSAAAWTENTRAGIPPQLWSRSGPCTPSHSFSLHCLVLGHPVWLTVCSHGQGDTLEASLSAHAWTDKTQKSQRLTHMTSWQWVVPGAASGGESCAPAWWPCCFLPLNAGWPQDNNRSGIPHGPLTPQHCAGEQAVRIEIQLGSFSTLFIHLAQNYWIYFSFFKLPVK